MKQITKKQWQDIPKDYKGVWMAYNNEHPEWKGKKVAFLPRHGTTLFIEGISFEIV